MILSQARGNNAYFKGAQTPYERDAWRGTKAKARRQTECNAKTEGMPKQGILLPDMIEGLRRSMHVISKITFTD